MTSGTVVFASGVDGWAFTTHDLVTAHSTSFPGHNIDDLNELIGDCDKYWDKKSLSFCSGAQQKDCANLFTQLALAPIRSAYDKIVTKGDVKYGAEFLKKRGIDLEHIKRLEANPPLMARLMLSIQFPLAVCVVDQCYKVFPPPGKKKALVCN